MTTMTVTTMAVTGGPELESGDSSLRDTVTGDEKSPPPIEVTACTCEHDINMTDNEYQLCKHLSPGTDSLSITLYNDSACKLPDTVHIYMEGAIYA